MGKTISVAFRLPNNVYSILERRANKQGIKTAVYLRKRVIYDTMRSHHSKKES